MERASTGGGVIGLHVAAELKEDPLAEQRHIVEEGGIGILESPAVGDERPDRHPPAFAFVAEQQPEDRVGFGTDSLHVVTIECAGLREDDIAVGGQGLVAEAESLGAHAPDVLIVLTTVECQQGGIEVTETCLTHCHPHAGVLTFAGFDERAPGSRHGTEIGEGEGIIALGVMELSQLVKDDEGVRRIRERLEAVTEDAGTIATVGFVRRRLFAGTESEPVIVVAAELEEVGLYFQNFPMNT